MMLRLFVVQLVIITLTADHLPFTIVQLLVTLIYMWTGLPPSAHSLNAAGNSDSEGSDFCQPLIYIIIDDQQHLFVSSLSSAP